MAPMRSLQSQLKTTENCLLMETGSKWHTHTTFTHPAKRAPTHTVKRCEHRVLSVPAAIWHHLFMKCTLFYTGWVLVRIRLRYELDRAETNPAEGRNKGRKPGAVTKSVWSELKLEQFLLELRLLTQEKPLKLEMGFIQWKRGGSGCGFKQLEQVWVVWSSRTGPQGGGWALRSGSLDLVWPWPCWI